ncbi:MAG: RNA polymerase sigma factor [Deltaproteobacteria bacterium]|nr:RNA polymerase sigma factor [Deltaproteobacteria bacterium]
MRLESLHEETDEKLMKAVAGKHTGALRELMRRHEARVRRLAFRFTGSDDAACELVQDVFFKVYTSAASYSPQARFTTWLYRITANHCLNYIRDSRREPLQQRNQPIDEAGHGLTDDCAMEGQLTCLEKKEQAARVRSAVDGLPERQRMAILLLRFEELSYRDAASALNCSVSALEALVHRGLETLKKQLSDSV